MKSPVIVHKILAFSPKHFFYCFFPCSCHNSGVQFINSSPEPARQNNGSEIFPFSIFRFRRNIRTVKVIIAKLRKNFKGCFFNFGFGDEGGNKYLSFFICLFFFVCLLSFSFVCFLFCQICASPLLWRQIFV
ncbi:hypothetical protein MSTHC_2257 [Methanosarcina thermophila CHTI-55]|uniref:Uncharacterized protein n=1 Tax=Methanosarcina thermophila CHTI-55 TaxID=1434121 RepID=A0A0E3NJH8_METTE|nr:hypothetical protein MSTHC_2257 [Methanosarcina thermophila CHTI-55]